MLSMSKIVNQEALDSQIYNPTTKPAVLMLQQIMETTPVPAPSATQQNPPPPLVDSSDTSIVPPELKEHVDAFFALPTTNPYHGVLVNPASCLIDDIRGSLDDLNNAGQALDNASGQTDWSDYQDDFDQDSQDINSDLDSIQDHTDRLTSNLPSLAGVAQGALALATVMNLLSNPCLGLDGMLGSIMDSGKQLLNDVTNQIKAGVSQVNNALSDLTSAIQSGVQSAISAAKAAISPLMDQIKDGISVAKQQVSAFISKAQTEVMNFAKAALAQLRQGLAELMANLPQDPCLKGLLTSAATGAAAAIIK